MVPSPLSQPVAVLARGTSPLAEEDSIALAARRLRESGTGVVPLLADGRYSGVVTERSLAEGLARGVEAGAPAREARDTGELQIAPHVTGAEALRMFNGLGMQALVVVDASGRVLGVLSPSDLLPQRIVPPRPPLIGGMATPFGVYLTTGVVRAGAGDLALVLTGMLLFALLSVATFVADFAQDFLLGRGAKTGLADFVAELLLITTFAIAMRVVPLSRIHAAEHKVVHAIERGEELTLPIVRRMPRVHPRCGTNLAVGASIFLGLATSALIPDETVRLLTSLVLTLLFWKRIGAIVQTFVTTAPPRDRHLEMGIRSGQELLRKYVESPVTMPNFGQRIYNSGMLHVMLGSLLCSGLVLLIARALHIDL